MISLAWRGPFLTSDLSRLHREAFGDAGMGRDWRRTVGAHSLGWVTARRDGDVLVGFVNVAWDGADHAFVLDTLVSSGFRRRGIGERLVRQAVEGARDAGCRWLHVDYEERLVDFYLQACGFTPTAAGTVRLR